MRAPSAIGPRRALPASAADGGAHADRATPNGVRAQMQKQKAPPPNPDDVKGAASSAPPVGKVDVQLEIDGHAKLRVMATVYAGILLKHSNYANTQQERQFFESLYDFSARVLFVINDRKRWQSIENELSRVFRSDYFNLSLRKNEQSAKGSGSRGGCASAYVTACDSLSRRVAAYNRRLPRRLCVRLCNSVWQLVIECDSVQLHITACHGAM